MYSDNLREHATNPRNRREMEQPTVTGSAFYRRCGDKLTMYFRIQDGVVTECTFTARGCGPVVAAASIATTMLQGRSLELARSLSSFTLNRALGGMPASKRHSLLLVLQCLNKALEHIPNNNSI